MKLPLKIIPSAKKNEIVGLVDGVLKVKIQAPPVDGKANKELIRFLSKEWKVSKSQITIVQGKKGKVKLLEVPDAIGQKISG